MTTRLYYTDPLLRTFDGTVVSADAVGGRFHVVLDRTAFYPTSGGQPFDVGVLGDARVVDVIDRDDGEIAHVVERTLPVGQRVAGEIDWPRRFDHMQQHTGQHILSAAFDRVAAARTVSFHLGSATSTIDLAREVTPREIADAEEAASRIVFDDRPVTIRFASEEEAAALPLRKEPKRTGLLRLVEVADFDLSACGGTHMPRTGMVGLIAIAGWERFKGGTRIAFVCGDRARRSHAALRDVVAQATKLLSVGAAELATAIERTQHDARELARRVRGLEEKNAGYVAAELLAGAASIQGARVVITHLNADATALKSMAAALAGTPGGGVLAILVGDGQPTPVVVARSADVALDAGVWMKNAAEKLGGRGGGRPEQAQGGLAAPTDAILAYARAALAQPAASPLRHNH
jgi:alanyl-tRNA synthetase